jgi:hypothetical protein
MKVSIAVEMTMTWVCLPDLPEGCGPAGDDDDDSPAEELDEIAALLMKSDQEPQRVE